MTTLYQALATPTDCAGCAGCSRCYAAADAAARAAALSSPGRVVRVDPDGETRYVAEGRRLYRICYGSGGRRGWWRERRVVARW